MLKSVLEASVRIGNSSATTSTPSELGRPDTATGCTLASAIRDAWLALRVTPAAYAGEA
jgi:hypothetical protein